MKRALFSLIFCLFASASIIDDAAARILSRTSGASATAMAALTSSGNFSNINYLSGCAASRASWAAPDHWAVTSAGAMYWYKTNDTATLTAVKRAMDFWFANDFTDGPRCNGDTTYESCPCNMAGLWNTNWWYQVIYTPKLAGIPCMALSVRNQLSPQQKQGCIRLLNRGGLYVSKYSGANQVDTALVAVYLSIVTRNESLLLRTMDVVNHACDIVSYQDGINSDGSFIQHGALPYAYGYGERFTVDVFDLWDNVGLPPKDTQKAAMSLFLRSSVWSIYFSGGTPNWDFNQMGRCLTYSATITRYTGPWSTIQNTAVAWNDSDLATAMGQLKSNSSLQGVNPFKLNGVKVFYKADYLVYRGDHFVLGLKMLSTRTFASECWNSEGKQGLHYSDGVVYNYVNGVDYPTSQVFWGYTPPGVTVDPTSHTLGCSNYVRGLTKFVGSVSNGNTALSAMDYISPTNRQLTYKKSWHFFGGLYVVVATDIAQSKGLPVITALDNRISRGDVYTDAGLLSGPSGIFNKAQYIHHDLVGYYFPSPNGLTLNVSNGNVSGNWIDIGAHKEPVTAKIFKPILTTTTGSFIYVTVPGVNRGSFSEMLPSLRSAIQVISATRELHAVQHVTNRTVTAAFFSAGNVTFYNGRENVTLAVDVPCLLTVTYGNADDTTAIHVVDPTQTLSRVVVRVQCKTCVLGGNATVNIAFATGWEAGATRSYVLNVRKTGTTSSIA